MSTDILETIATQRCIDVKAAKAVATTLDLEAKISKDFPAPPIDLAKLTSATGVAIIAAEFKRASPSKGLMVASEALPIEPSVTAYVNGGAHLLSVLTEPKWFKGSLQDMESARRTVDKLSAESGKQRPAILRKDFVVDSYQVYEARAYGADTLLLIVSLLPTVETLKPLIDQSRALGMEPLVEVNSTEELEVAVAAGSRVIGVNNRNLRTFVVDMGTTARVVAAAAAALASAAPPSQRVAILSLSGLRSAEDIPPLVDECIAETRKAMSTSTRDDEESVRAGAIAALRGFLIGEALMRSSDPQKLVSEFVSQAAAVSSSSSASLSSGSSVTAAVLVKICGVKRKEDALLAAQTGADLIGMIAVKESPRFVGLDGGAAITAALKAFREQDPSPILAQLLESAAKQAAAPATMPLHEVFFGLSERWQLLCRAARKARPLSVGVFMNQGPDAVLSEAATLGVDVLQLHGKEESCEAWGTAAVMSIKPIVKVVHIPVPTDDSDIEDACEVIVKWARAGVSGLLLDTTVKAASFSSIGSGGTGKSFDHVAVMRQLGGKLGEALAAASSSSSSPVSLPIMLAGGLTPETVADAASLGPSGSASLADVAVASALATLRVAAVDVSSGVEADGAPKGTKDALKVVAFIKNAEAAGTASAP